MEQLYTDKEVLQDALTAEKTAIITTRMQMNVCMILCARQF